MLPEAVINQHIFKCMPADGIPGWLLEGCLLDALPEFIRIAADKAVTMGHIRRSDLDSPMWAIPDIGTLRAMAEVIDPLLTVRISLEREAHLLTEVRDLLLPKLISGDIRVPDAEEAVAAA
jgi:type I restriction enzyme S subunit